jgi:hypothetical protein
MARMSCETAQTVLTMPLFRLFPGRPRRIFSSCATFFGGIFFRLEYCRLLNSGIPPERKVHVAGTQALAAASGRKRRVDEMKREDPENRAVVALKFARLAGQPSEQRQAG